MATSGYRYDLQPGGRGEGTGGGGTANLISVSPNLGDQAGALTVALNGNGFTGTTGATFGGTSATNYTVVSDILATCTTPLHAVGAVNVVLGGSTLTNGYTFTNTPNIITTFLNASFEAADGDGTLTPTGQWDGFKNGSFVTPSGPQLSISTDRAYSGSQSVKFGFSNTGSDVGAQVFYNVRTAGTHLWARTWFYGTAFPNGSGFKFFRQQDTGLSGRVVGVQILNNRWIWVTPSGSVVYIGNTLPSLNTWHWIEFEVDFTNTLATVWVDGTLLTDFAIEFDAGETPSFNGTAMNYKTNSIYTFPGFVDIVEIVNQCTNSGSWYFDRVAISSLGRIGP